MRNARLLRRAKTPRIAPDAPTTSDAHLYKAFISYSHAVDGKLAPALQDALQRFTKPWYRRRALRVFRDETNLGANPALWSSIQAALATSEFFILLASPEAARSPWVEREIKYWLSHRPKADFLIVLTSGTIAWDEATGDFDWKRTTALPISVRNLFEEEPRYIDLRWARTVDHVALGHPEFRNSVADLAVPLYGRAKDDLVGEDIRAHRRTLAIVRGVIAVLTALVLAIGGLASLFVGQRNAARRAARTAESRALAAEARLSLERQPAFALLQSLRALQQWDTVEAEGSLLTALQYDPRNTAFLPMPGGASSVTFSPDGQLLASGSDDGSIVLWDRRRRQPLGEPLRGHSKAVTSVAFSPDGELLASGSNDKSVVLWDVRRHEPLGAPLIGHTDVVTSVAFSPDGRVLASGSDDGTTRLWDVIHHKPLGKPLVNKTFVVKSLAFSPAGASLAAAGTNAVVLWDVRGRRPVQRLPVDGGVAHDVAFSADGRTLATGMDDGTIAIWDGNRHWQLGKTASANQDATPRPSETAVTSVAFSPNGATLASASEGKVTLWSVQRRRPIAKPLTGHSDVVTGLDFSPDGNTLASASGDRTLILWDVKHDPSLGQPLHSQVGPIEEVAVAADKPSLAATEAGVVALWDIRRHRPLGQLRSGDGYIMDGLALSADGRLLAAGSQDGTVQLWDLRTRQVLGQPLASDTRGTTKLAFSPDGRLLAAGSQDGTVQLWDLRTRQVLGQPLASDAGGVASLAFSPDGGTIAAGTDVGYVRMWDVGKRRPLSVPLSEQTLAVTGLAFTPDGQFLASASNDGTIVVWDVQRRRRVAEFAGDAGRVNSIAISSEGRFLASGSEDGAIRLWDVPHRQLIGTLTGHSASVSNVAFSRDAQRLVSSGFDGRILLWAVGAEPWRARACHIIEPLARSPSILSLSNREYDQLCG
jgi:WD40 repeat protein